MKKILCVLLAAFTCFAACRFSVCASEASLAQELKAQWYDTRFYPVFPEGSSLPYQAALDVLNPPPDLLVCMSAEELAALMQDYPLLFQFMTYFNEEGEQDYITFFGFLETNCDIFYELLRREDGIACLLKEYQTHEFDTEAFRAGVSSPETDQMLYAEVFGCQFIRYYAHHFTESEYELAAQIIEEKKGLYEALNPATLYYLDLPEIEPGSAKSAGGVRTNYLRPEEIQEKEDILTAALLKAEQADGLRDDDNEPAPDSAEAKNMPRILTAVGAVICAACAICVFALFLRRSHSKTP